MRDIKDKRDLRDRRDVADRRGGFNGFNGFWWGMMGSKRGDVKLCFGVYKSIPANAGE